ncbi:diguanylate cyclase [Thiomicrorhabdus sp. zzn3]|uniref:sensor domain-containing diguanylate cyclase n=1 Tax=Thiomicrorhabdus sp. zzn3 TaxID=3039775 RepID=UPI002436F909|nr:sensor domain-containing diguanylate cyclase [Thiomicrorhabdus sp. zzn3]MDG6778696.1 diguanylate cyclase [Thiomicrorhabdus sp. zzn3]
MRRSKAIFLMMMASLFVLVTSLMWWRVDSELRQFSRYQQELMTKQAHLSANSINSVISSLRKRMIAVSLDEFWLKDLEHYKTVDKMQDALKARFKLYFPEMYAFTIANELGEPLWGDLDLFVSEACREDIEKTAGMIGRNTPYFDYQPQIHAKPDAYHFDMMFPVFWNQQKLVFFMSFKTDSLVEALKENQLSNHTTYLLRVDKPGLIEATAQGSRDKLSREFFLQPQELQRIGARERVAHTLWEAVVVENPEVKSAFVAKVAKIATLSLALFFLLWVSLLWFGVHYERKRGYLFNKLNHLSLHDELTGLANRRKLLKFLGDVIEEAQKHGDYSGLLYMDLDGFKMVNDHYGHDVGDALLVAFGDRLQASVRKEDLAARMGGDEFVVLLNKIGQNPEEASRTLEETKERFYESLSEPYLILGHRIITPPSIGAVLIDLQPHSVEFLLKQADAAMYRHKMQRR